MLHVPIPRPQCYSSPSVSSLRVSWPHLALLCLFLQSPRPGNGQSELESACRIAPRPDLVGLGTTPEDDKFGHDTSLSLDGTIAAIGAPEYGESANGFVQVLRFENNAWTQLGNRSIIGANLTRTSATALSDDGSVVAVGGLFTSNLRVFQLVDDRWKPLGNFITNPSGKFIGHALALSGDGTIVATGSSPFANGIGFGDVLVFELVGGMWIQKGRTLQGQGEEDDFGYSISLSQDGIRLAVGTPDIFIAESNGFVRVFEFIDNDWVQIGQTLEGSNNGDQFGRDVSLSSGGRTLAVGSPSSSDANSDNLGSVHVYRYGSDGQWFKPGSVLIGKSENEFFGGSVALSGDTSILVASGSGVLRMFLAGGTEWIEVEGGATNSSGWNDAAISRDGSTAMGGASVFDVSCPQGKAPDTTTSDPVLSPTLPTTPTTVPRPTPAPVKVPKVTPIAVPSLLPSPTGNTEPPVDDPTVPSPTTGPVAAKALPTSAPRTNPTAGTTVQVTFSDISLSFKNVSLMSEPEIETFEWLTKTWYEEFFDQRSGRVLQSSMLATRNMQTSIEVVNQKVLTSEDESVFVNKITYMQTIVYTAEANNLDVNVYITLPFVDDAANTEYGAALKSELNAFRGLQSPLPIPQSETVPDTGGDANDGEGSEIAVIVGASIGSAVCLAIAVFVGFRVKKQKEERGESFRVLQQPNPLVESQDQTSAQRSCTQVEYQGQSLASAAGVIVYDGHGQALRPRNPAAQTVLLANDNPTTLQELLPKFKDQVRPR